MKRALFALLFAVVALPAAAQQGNPAHNYDFEAPLYTVVDVASSGWFSGWSGDCNSGRIPQAITLWRREGSTVVNVPVTLTTGARPDAAGWLASTCGRPFDVSVGWSLVPQAPLTPGLYAVLVTDVPTSWTCRTMPLNYPNAGQMVCDYQANEVLRTIAQ